MAKFDMIVFNKTECDMFFDGIVRVNLPSTFDMVVDDIGTEEACGMLERVTKDKIKDEVIKRITSNDELPKWEKDNKILYDDEQYGFVIFKSYRQYKRFTNKNPFPINKIASKKDGKHNVILDMPIHVTYNFRFDIKKNEFVSQFMYDDCGCYILEDV